MSGSPDVPGSSTVPLADILVTDELDRRRSRPADHDAENRALRGLAGAMANAPGTVLQRLADAAMALTRSGSAGVSVLEPRDEPDSVRWIAVSGALARHRGDVLPSGSSPCGEVRARDGVLLLREPGRRYPSLLGLDAGVREMLLAPFHAEGRPAGAVWAIRHDRQDRFEREDARLLEGLAGFAAATHALARLLQDARPAGGRNAMEPYARHADAELLQKLSTSLISEQAPGALYEESLTVAMALMRADAASLQILAPEGDRLILLASRNLHPRSVAYWHTVDAGDASPCGQSLRAHARVLVGDAETDPSLVGTQDLEEFRRSGIRAAQATPLVTRSGQPVGLLSIHWREPRRLDHADTRLLDVLVRQLADLFERNAAEAASRQAKERQALLLRLSDAVRTISDPAEIEPIAMRMLGEHLGLAGTYYFSVARDDHGWVHDVESAYQREPDRPGIIGRHSLAQFGAWMFEGFERGDPIVASDVAAIPSLTEAEIASYGALGVVAFVNVPLLRHGTYGAGIGAHDVVPRAWAPAELALIREVGERTWLAVERSRAEAAQRESEERLRQFGEVSQDILWIRDAETLQWTYLTPAFETIYGLTREAALAGDNYRAWQDLIVPEDRVHAVTSIKRVGSGEHVTFEYRIRRPADGQVRWLRNTDFPMRDRAGTVVRIGGVGHDITTLKAIQAAMAESERRLRTLMEGIPQLVWRSSDRGLWTWCSPQWMTLTGQDQDQSHGFGWLDAVHPDDHPAAMREWQAAQPHGTLDVEYRVRRASDSAWLWHRTRSVPVRDAAGPDGGQGRILEWLGTTTDIHNLKHLQGEQQVLVAELQHRTRNLLAVVRSIARRSIGASPGLDEYDARLASLGRVQGFLSRSSAYTVPLADIVHAELQAAGDGASAKVEITGPPAELPGESVQAVALALHELATNAVKYGAIARPSGRLTVTWRIEQGDDGRRLVIDWHESGVSLPDGPPARRGYGTELITRALPYQLRAETALRFTPDGVRCRITLPADAFSARTQEEVA